MWIEWRRAMAFTAVTMLLLGLGYPMILWGVGHALFPEQAEGSVIRRVEGAPVGSRLIAQEFTRPEYFHPRPSAVDYDAASAGGSNLGPSNPDHLRAVKDRLDAIALQERVDRSQVPSEMITSSASGLDPHLPPRAAELQASRVAAARGVPVERIRALIRAHTQGPALGFLGRPVVNVLELNLALDAAGPPRAGRPGGG